MLAAAAADGSPITVLLGRPSLAEAAGPVVDAALALHDHLPEATFLSLLRRGNVHGALDMGLAPGLLPGRTTLADAGRVSGAWPTLQAATDEAVNGGSYWGPSWFFQMMGAPKQVRSNRHSRDLGTASKLWKCSQELTGIRFLDEAIG